MKNNIHTYLMICVLACSCATSKYLPSPENIPQNPYGSYIQIECKNKVNLAGELIAVEKDRLVLLGETTKKCISVEKNDILMFSVKYAQNRHYGIFIPLFTLVSLSHGYIALATLPINLVTTISVASTGEKAYVYQSANTTYQELKMFARFPQGIPADISLADIH